MPIEYDPAAQVLHQQHLQGCLHSPPLAGESEQLLLDGSECTWRVQVTYPKLYQRVSAHLAVLKRRITLSQMKQKPGNYEEIFETKESA